MIKRKSNKLPPLYVGTPHIQRRQFGNTELKIWTSLSKTQVQIVITSHLRGVQALEF